MTRIELTEKEVGFLIDILGSVLSDLKTEIVGTDNRAYHAELVEREKIVSDLIGRPESLERGTFRKLDCRVR